MGARYEGRIPDDSVNLPEVHPAREALTLFLGFVLVGILVFFSLGWITERAVLSMSTETEALLFKPFEAAFTMEDEVDTSSSAKRVERIFKNIEEQWETAPYEFVLRVMKGPPNAFAVPGGGVFVTSGLIAELESENELALILGHELGHFKNRDHLRGLSRQLAMMLVKLALFNMAGMEASNEQLLEFSALLSQRASDRGHEMAADEFGLKLVNSAFGHVAGTASFFERRMRREGFANTKIGSYFSTHPASKERIKAMHKIAIKSGYSRTGTITAW